MKLFLFVLCGVIFCITLCNAQLPLTFQKKFFVQQADTLRYRLLYPLNYDSNKTYPLLTFLHGSGARGNDNEAQLSNLPAEFLTDYNRKTFPCFLLVPQCAKDDSWVNFPNFPNNLKATDTPTPSARLVLSLLDKLPIDFSIDNRRMYLTGYSMGGEGVFDFIARKPNFFAASAPICAVADTAKAEVIKDNNLWVFHGSDDKVNDVKYSRLLINALRIQGANPDYTEYLGVGHRAWSLAYQEPDLLPWMFSHIKTHHPDTDNKPIVTRQDTLMGSITPEREWWDVLHYDLNIFPHFETRALSGSNTILYKVKSTNSNLMQIDLQQPLAIDSVVLDKKISISFKGQKHHWFLQMPAQKIGSEHSLTIYYSGIPHVAKSPPWHGGITWTRDSLNRPWIATSCQLTGASVWYPCKNHQSDEPDRGATISITVPDTLVAVSNGKLVASKQNNDKTTSFTWNVMNTINSYGICLM